MNQQLEPKTFAEKVLARAAGLAETRAGALVEVRPDRVLTHDNTAAIARIFYEQLGWQQVADPEQLCITLDHAAPPPTPKHAQNHAETRRFVKEQGIRHFFEVGRGICHQVLSEEGLVLPGDLILGADSHTTHYGWLGAFGAGVGRSEAAVLWATGRLWLRVPLSLRFHLIGELPAGVTTKDLSLFIIGELGADGGLYASVEFSGPGVSSLSLESRMVIPNMMAEFGVKNAYLPPDEAVFAYLAEQLGQAGQGTKDERRKTKDDGRHLAVTEELKERALYPDEGARYLAEYSLDLGQLEPQVACPHSVEAVQPLSKVAGRKIDLAFIGTCTNGRLEDLAAAAEVLRGRKVHPGTRLLVIPASSQVYRQALQAGVLEVLVEAGAAIGTPGCGPCMGNHLGIPAAGEVVLSTANRNFRGRMGQPEAEIYLAAPAVVAASAILGRIAPPGELEPRRGSPIQSRSGKPGVSPRDPAVMIPISENTSPGEIYSSQKGGPPAKQTGKVWRYGNNVNTDQIFPGKYTYTLVTTEEIASHALEDLDPSFAGSVQAGDVIFSGRNFGCGSSREQAVTCLAANGVAAIVAESFARIFYRNAINQGLAAIVCPAAVQSAQPGDPVQVDLAAGLIHLPSGSFSFPPFPEHIQAILKVGGLIPYVRAFRLPGSFTARTL